MKNKRLFLLPLVFFLISVVAAENFQNIEIDIEDVPEFFELTEKDENFKNYSTLVAENYKRLAQLKDKYAKEKKAPILTFYKYKVPEKMTLIQLAARCNILQETIATINDISNSGEEIKGKTLLIPTVRGLFVSENSSKSIHIILRNRSDLDLQSADVCYNYNGLKFVFFPNVTFSPTERAYFLDASISLPIDPGLAYISSGFGRRKNPFSGEWKNHNGIDFAASEGTPVKAMKSGIVSVNKKCDSTFGNYIVIKHDTNNMTSVYAHLSKINVSLNEQIKTGDVIGFVGHTGMATGDHLHFEVRVGGKAEDPAKKLPLRNNF